MISGKQTLTEFVPVLWTGGEFLEDVLGLLVRGNTLGFLGYRDNGCDFGNLGRPALQKK